MDTQTTKELLNAPQRGEIILYQTADGRTKIDVKLENETVWLTQAQIAALMGNIKTHLKHLQTGRIGQGFNHFQNGNSSM